MNIRIYVGFVKETQNYHAYLIDNDKRGKVPLKAIIIGTNKESVVDSIITPNRPEFINFLNKHGYEYDTKTKIVKRRHE